METKLLDQKINTYKKKIAHLDTHATQLSRPQRIAYESARSRFTARLRAWQKSLGSDLAIFRNNMTEGYNELEAHFVRR